MDCEEGGRKLTKSMELNALAQMLPLFPGACCTGQGTAIGPTECVRSGPCPLYFRFARLVSGPAAELSTKAQPRRGPVVLKAAFAHALLGSGSVEAPFT